MDFNISSTKKKRCKFTTLRWHNHVKKPMHIFSGIGCEYAFAGDASVMHLG